MSVPIYNPLMAAGVPACRFGKDGLVAAPSSHIVVNGRPEPVEPGETVASLVARFDLQPARVAVEVNEKLVRRRDYEAVGLAAGDRIEIVTFVGGG